MYIPRLFPPIKNMKNKSKEKRKKAKVLRYYTIITQKLHALLNSKNLIKENIKKR